MSASSAAPIRQNLQCMVESTLAKLQIHTSSLRAEATTIDAAVQRALQVVHASNAEVVEVEVVEVVEMVEIAQIAQIAEVIVVAQMPRQSRSPRWSRWARWPSRSKGGMRALPLFEAILNFNRDTRVELVCCFRLASSSSVPFTIYFGDLSVGLGWLSPPRACF